MVQGVTSAEDEDEFFSDEEWTYASMVAKRRRESWEDSQHSQGCWETPR
jgi:hypothetical protein